MTCCAPHASSTIVAFNCFNVLLGRRHSVKLQHFYRSIQFKMIRLFPEVTRRFLINCFVPTKVRVIVLWDLFHCKHQWHKKITTCWIPHISKKENKENGNSERSCILLWNYSLSVFLIRPRLSPWCFISFSLLYCGRISNLIRIQTTLNIVLRSCCSVKEV